MPTGTAVMQAVFDDPSDGGSHNPKCVVAFRQGEVVHGGIGVGATTGTTMLRVGDEQQSRRAHDEERRLGGTTMLRVGDEQQTWPVEERVSEVVELSGGGAEAIGAASTGRAAASPEVTTAWKDLRCRQILDAGDAFRDIAGISSG